MLDIQKVKSYNNNEVIFLNDGINSAWDTVFDRFFCPETNLIYEFVVDDENNAWHHLPSPEDIKECIPNPRGWGTGMEDSALNGGCALEALVSAYGMKRDEGIKSIANLLLNGLLSLEKDGFVARSISPFDKKSYYPESSRDQYTHYVYSLLSYFHSPLCTKEQKSKIKASLLRIAEKCEKEVTERNDFHMLRADGEIGLVGKMWGELLPHEWLRLPMFYLAASVVLGDKHFKDLYLKYRDEAFENSLLPMQKNARCYCYLQMQYSLRLIYDFEKECDFKQKVLLLMQKNAEYGRNKAITNSVEFTKTEYRDKLSYRFIKWNEAERFSKTVEYGTEYFNPAQSERKDNVAFYPVREVAEGAICAALCPGAELDGILDAVENMAEAIDFKKHTSVYAPLLLPCAYIYLKEREKI